MFIKRTLYAFTTATLVFFFSTGCSLINDKPKAQVSFQNENLNLNCLPPLPNQLELLFEGKYTQEKKDQNEVNSIWACLDKSLHSFASYTQGAHPNFYTQTELAQFANRYFPADHPLTPAFTDAIFRLKKAVLGGSDQNITQLEIEKLRKKLTTFGEIILPLSSQIGILLRTDEKTTIDKREPAKQLNQFVKNFALLLKDSENPLLWQDLSAFISELEKYTRSNTPTALTVVREQIGLYPYLKLILVGGEEALIEPKNWEPLFRSFSKIYDAIYLSTSFSDFFQGLNLEITSQESDRIRAVSQITNLLKILKTDPHLYSRDTIQNLSDGWAKLLLMNSFLFSKSQGSLAIKTFFDSTSLRRITGYILDHIKNINLNEIKEDDLRTLSDQIATLIKQAGSENNEIVGTLSTVSFKSLKEYSVELKPLFKDPAQWEWFQLGLDLIQSIEPILSDKESDFFTPDDFENLIQKTTELFITWNRNHDHSVFESISTSLNIILTPSTPTFIHAKNIDQSIILIQKLMQSMGHPSTLPWDEIKSNIEDAFHLKAKLLHSSPQTISANELKIINDDLGTKLSALTKSFKPGLNSSTLDLAVGVLNAIGDLQKATITYDSLKDIIITSSAKAGFTVRSKTLEELFIGLNHRVLRGQKTPKPKTLLPSDGLRPASPDNPIADTKKLVPMLERMKDQLIELETVFAGMPIDSALIEKETLLSQLQNPNLISIIKTFQPQLSGPDHLLKFPPLGKTITDYSFFDLAYKVTLKELLTWVLPFYQIEEDPKPSLIRLSLNDLTDLLEDLNDAVYDFKQEYTLSTPEISAKKRMQTFNLFMQTSNGDQYADLNEIIEFLTMATAGKQTLEKTLSDLNQKCESTSLDSIKITCLTKYYFNLSEIKNIYQMTIPQLVDLYQSLDSDGINALRIATLNSVLPGWKEPDTMQMDDFETFITLPNYIENVFQRLDLNHDGKLEFSEAMNGFPIFCDEIRIAAGNDSESCDPEHIQDASKTELIYGHLLFKGTPPRALKKGDSIFTIGEKAVEYYQWKKFWKHLDRDPDVRDQNAPLISRKDLIEIISHLATNAAKPEPQSQTP